MRKNRTLITQIQKKDYTDYQCNHIKISVISVKGFSLIEILISAAILSLVILGILGILQFADMTWHSDMGLLDLQQAARQAMDGITREIRRADRLRNVTIAADGTSIQFYIPDYADSITYSLSNNQIIRQHPGGTSRVLANDISSLSFCWLHSDGSCTSERDCGGVCSKSYLAQVQLRAGKTVKQRALVFPIAGPLTEQVRLRNE